MSNWNQLVHDKGLKEKFLLDCANLLMGETTRDIACPACGTTEKDFSVTLSEEGLLYNCFRNKCGLHGIMPVVRPQMGAEELKKRTEQARKNNPKRKTNPYQGPTWQLTAYEKNQLAKIYHIPVAHVEDEGWMVDRSNPIRRVLLPIYAQNGMRIGMESKFVRDFSLSSIRDQNVDVTHKSLTYWDKPADEAYRIHFPRSNYNRPFINKQNGSEIWLIVEDIPSAVSVAPYVPTVALLGSGISEANMDFFRGKTVIFCLDEDATIKAVNLVKKHYLMFAGYQVIPILKDPKNMTQDEIAMEIVNKIRV